MTLLVIMFTPEDFHIFQIFAIPHGGPESAHFSISNTCPKKTNLTTKTVCGE